MSGVWPACEQFQMAITHGHDFLFGSRLGFLARTDCVALFSLILTSYMDFIMIGLLLKEALDSLRVRLNIVSCLECELTEKIRGL